MARSKVRLEFNPDGFRELMRTPELVEGRAASIAAACNAESSWGEYDHETSVSAIRARARVWVVGASEARAQRLLRNLDAGS